MIKSPKIEQKEDMLILTGEGSSKKDIIAKIEEFAQGKHEENSDIKCIRLELSGETYKICDALLFSRRFSRLEKIEFNYPDTQKKITIFKYSTKSFITCVRNTFLNGIILENFSFKGLELVNTIDDKVSGKEIESIRGYIFKNCQFDDEALKYFTPYSQHGLDLKFIGYCNSLKQILEINFKKIEVKELVIEFVDEGHSLDYLTNAILMQRSKLSKLHVLTNQGEKVVNQGELKIIHDLLAIQEIISENKWSFGNYIQPLTNEVKKHTSNTLPKHATMLPSGFSVIEETRKRRREYLDEHSHSKKRKKIIYD